MTIKVVALGLDHRHIYGMLHNICAAGAACVGYWTDGEPNTLPGFLKRFPATHRFDALEDALSAGADLALISAIPGDRAALSIRAMDAGLDVMVDKPGCTTREQLNEIRACVSRTGRIWSINFSERVETPCSTLATKLVADGEIGTVVQTVGLGPHRLNRATRPDWFFQRQRYGGILTDLASHQIDQFLHYTGARDSKVVDAFVANRGNPQDPELQDFGELTLRSEKASGYIRVDWFTPDGLPTWGDGRLTILGTEGYIELRKYVDVAGKPGTDHVLLVNGSRAELIDASGAGLPYFERLVCDVQDRTETAMAQSHCFEVMSLALDAQEIAESAFQ